MKGIPGRAVCAAPARQHHEVVQPKCVASAARDRAATPRTAPDAPRLAGRRWQGRGRGKRPAPCRSDRQQRGRGRQASSCRHGSPRKRFELAAGQQARSRSLPADRSARPANTIGKVGPAGPSSAARTAPPLAQCSCRTPYWCRAGGVERGAPCGNAGCRPCRRPGCGSTRRRRLHVVDDVGVPVGDGVADGRGWIRLSSRMLRGMPCGCPRTRKARGLAQPASRTAADILAALLGPTPEDPAGSTYWPRRLLSSLSPHIVLREAGLALRAGARQHQDPQAVAGRRRAGYWHQPLPGGGCVPLLRAGQRA